MWPWPIKLWLGLFKCFAQNWTNEMAKSFTHCSNLQLCFRLTIYFFFVFRKHFRLHRLSRKTWKNAEWNFDFYSRIRYPNIRCFTAETFLDKCFLTSKFGELWSPPGNNFDLEEGQRSRSRSRHGVDEKGLSQRSCMPNINALSLILQKIWARLKFLWQTDRGTDRGTDGQTNEF